MLQHALADWGADTRPRIHGIRHAGADDAHSIPLVHAGFCTGCVSNSPVPWSVMSGLGHRVCVFEQSVARMMQCSESERLFVACRRDSLQAEVCLGCVTSFPMRQSPLIFGELEPKYIAVLLEHGRSIILIATTSSCCARVLQV